MMLQVKKDKLFLIIYYFIFLYVAFSFFVFHASFYEKGEKSYLNTDSKYYVELSGKMEDFHDAMVYFLGSAILEQHEPLNLTKMLLRSSVVRNLMGQVLYYRFFLQESRLLFFIFNSAILFYIYLETYKNIPQLRNKMLLLFLLLLNPAIAPSLSGPNKEITGFIAVLLVINYLLNTKKTSYLVFALVFALITRVELFGVIICFFIFRKYNKRSKYLLFSILIFLISYVIFSSSSYTYQLLNVFDKRPGTLGIVMKMAQINRMGFFILTFIPKLAINLVGDIFALNVFSLEGYQTVIYFSQIFFLIICFFILIKKKLNFNNPFFVFLFIYSLVFSIPAFIQHRYFIPVYPMFLFTLFISDDCNFKNKS